MLNQNWRSLYPFCAGSHSVPQTGLGLMRSFCVRFPRSGLWVIATTPCLKFSLLILTNYIGENKPHCFFEMCLQSYALSIELKRAFFVQRACRCLGRREKGPPARISPAQRKNTLDPGEVLVWLQCPSLHQLHLCRSYRRSLEVLGGVMTWVGQTWSSQPPDEILPPPLEQICCGGQGYGLEL